MFKLPLILISVSSLVLAACGSSVKTVVKESVSKKEASLVKKKKSSGGGGGSSSGGSSTPTKLINPYVNIKKGTIKTGIHNLGVFGFDFTKDYSKTIKDAVNTYAKDKNASSPGLGASIIDPTPYPGLVLQISSKWNYAKDYNPAFRTNFKLFYDALKAKLKIQVNGAKNAIYHSVGNQDAFDSVALFMYKNNDFTLEKKDHIVNAVTIYDAITPVINNVTLDPTNGGSNLYVKYSNLAQANNQLYAANSDFWKPIGPLLTKVDAIKTKPLDLVFIDLKNTKNNLMTMYNNLITANIFKMHSVLVLNNDSKTGEANVGLNAKLYINKNISSANYSSKISAFNSGFQSTIKAIKYDDKVKKFVKTKVGFFIGGSSWGSYGTVCDNATAINMIMFINGIKAATKHPKYKHLLDVKFIKNYPKGGKTIICRETDKWIDDNEKDNLLYQALKSNVMTQSEVNLVALLPIGIQSYWKNNIFSKITIGGKKIIDEITKPFSVISSFENVEIGTNKFDNKMVSSWGETGFVLDNGGNDSSRKKVKNRQNYIDNFMQGYFFGGPNYMVGTHTYYGNELEWLEEDGNRKIGYGLNISNESKVRSKELMQKAYHDATAIDISKIINLDDPTFTD